MWSFIFGIIILIQIYDLLKNRKKNISTTSPMAILYDEFDISCHKHQEYLRYAIHLLRSVDYRAIPNYQQFCNSSVGLFLYKNPNHPVILKIKDEIDKDEKFRLQVQKVLEELEIEDKKIKEREMMEKAKTEAERIFTERKNQQ